MIYSLRLSVLLPLYTGNDWSHADFVFSFAACDFRVTSETCILGDWPLNLEWPPYKRNGLRTFRPRTIRLRTIRPFIVKKWYFTVY